MTDQTLTYSDRLALALCAAMCATNSNIGPCNQACNDCRFQAAAVTQELAAILRERHGSSSVADWLDGFPTMPLVTSTMERERTGDSAADQTGVQPGPGEVVAEQRRQPEGPAGANGELWPVYGQQRPDRPPAGGDRP